MKRPFQIHFLLLCFATVYATHGQVVTKTTPSPVSGTICPNVNTNYEVSRPDGFGACKITWSVVNGTITSANGQPSVTVKWNDTPGAKGKITATFSACGTTYADNDGKSAYIEELILSVKGRNFGSYTNYVNVDYCTRTQVFLQVPEMVVDGTGGIAEPPRTEVAYAWTLPSGWREVGTHRTEFGTAENFVTIEPTLCALPGIVKVEGVLIGVGLCDAAAPSAPATINLNGPAPYVTVVPEAGYTGPSYCNTDPVIFYANTNVGCGGAYNWSIPPSWSKVSQSNNSIVLRPSGDPSDSAPITATVAFDCGSTIQSGAFTPHFDEPKINAPQAICYYGTSVSLANAPSTGITWDGGANIIITSGQGTSSVVMTAATSHLSAPATIQASITCPGASPISVTPKPVWVGKPKMIARLNNGQLITYSTTYNQVCYYKEYNTVMDVSGSTYNNWQRIAANPSNTLWGQNGNDISFYFWAVGQTATFRLNSGNGCGGYVYDFKFKAVQCSSDPCSQQYQVSPNPANTELMITNIPAPCDPAMQSMVSVKTHEESDLVGIMLYDSDGQLVLSEEYTSEKKNAVLNVSSVTEGFYILKITNKTSVETHRIQIKR